MALAQLNPTYWTCRCSCGTIRNVAGYSLKSGDSRSCGCLNRELTGPRNRKDLSGRRFGRLVVLSSLGVDLRQRQRWLCKCDCGRRHAVAGGNLTSGEVLSCGCLLNDINHARCFNSNLSAEDRRRYRSDLRTLRGYDVLAALTKKILIRDNYTCLACGERGGSLAAHHIEPWALNRELRYAPANLVTLCKECHQQFHSLYGNDCDLEDLEDYLKP